MGKCKKISDDMTSKIWKANATLLGKRKVESTAMTSIEKQDSEETKLRTEVRASYTEKEVDKSIAEFFYGCGIPFQVARTSYFQNMIKAATNCASRAYIPPSYEKLRTSLLTSTKESLWQEMEGIRKSWVAFGCTLVCDGWSSTTNRPLLNVVCVCPKGDIFFKCHDTSGHEKSAEYIAQFIISCIQEIGDGNIMQVITDNASNCRRASARIVEKFPHITYGGCTAHGLDLALESIGNLDWVSNIVQNGKTSVKFITNHHFSQALF